MGEGLVAGDVLVVDAQDDDVVVGENLDVCPDAGRQGGGGADDLLDAVDSDAEGEFALGVAGRKPGDVDDVRTTPGRRRAGPKSGVGRTAASAN